jgi:hypothetical protein
VSHAVLLLGLRLVQGWAPAVVVAQGVRLVAGLVQRREQPNEPVRQEGTEGMSSQQGGWGVLDCRREVRLRMWGKGGHAGAHEDGSSSVSQCGRDHI